MAKQKKKNVNHESFSDFLERIYGQELVTSANNIFEKPRKVLNTVLSLDIALNGGIPEGTTCLITGKPGAGKTSLCLEILANAINNDKPAFYVDIEKRCQPSLLRTIKNLDSSKLQLIGHKTENLTLSAENWLDIIEHTVKNNPKSVIVVDSIAALSTVVEQDNEFGSNKDMAGVPKLLASFFRRTQQIISNNDVILIFISQLMSNRNPFSNKKWEEKGGGAVQYASSVWITVTWTKLWNKNPDTNAPDGQNMVCLINKSALGKPYLPCEIPLRFGHGIDKYIDLITNAENLGLVQKNGAWYTLPEFTEEKFQGKDALCNFISSKENNDIKNKLENNIRNLLIHHDS